MSDKILTRGDLANYLVKQAKAYKAVGIEASVRRNGHMNSFRAEVFDVTLAEAVLVDFINHVAANQCMDLGLYTIDLQPDEQAAMERAE